MKHFTKIINEDHTPESADETAFIDTFLDCLYLAGDKYENGYTLTLSQATNAAKDLYLKLNTNEGSVNESAVDDIELKTVKDVEDFILGLAKEGKIYHFDDDPHDIEIFTPEEADAIDAKMDSAFEICEQAYGPQGFWDGFIKDVFGPGYISFSGDMEPMAGDVYIVAGSGGPGNVRKADMATYKEVTSSMYDEAKGEYDGDALDAWFSSLPEA